MSETSTTNLYLQELRKLVIDYIGGHAVKVYLFGSRAKDTAHRTSDVDIALLPEMPLPDNFTANLRELVEESLTPYTVDIVDLSQADADFRKKVLQEGVLWKD